LSTDDEPGAATPTNSCDGMLFELDELDRAGLLLLIIIIPCLAFSEFLLFFMHPMFSTKFAEIILLLFLRLSPPLKVQNYETLVPSKFRRYYLTFINHLELRRDEEEASPPPTPGEHVDVDGS
jgi:hypothetical protein